MSAYEELKVWCEKHLKANEYIIGEDYPHIDFYPPCNCEIAVWFKPNGEYDFTEIYDQAPSNAKRKQRGKASLLFYLRPCSHFVHKSPARLPPADCRFTLQSLLSILYGSIL